MERTVMAGGREWRMRADALIPRLYRHKFGRDIVRDMSGLIKLCEKISKTDDEEEKEALSLEVVNHLEVFENVAWIFMWHAGEDVGESPDEWLESLDGVFSIYEALPAVVELWAENNFTTSKPKNPEGRR